GLQIEKEFVPTEKKIDLINQLSDCGYSKIEVTSFVSPKAVPNLRDAKEVVRNINRRSDVTFVALVPNVRGAEDALEAGIDEINLVMSASATHNRKNVNRTHKASLQEFKEIVTRVEGSGIAVNGTIVTSLGYLFEGDISKQSVLDSIEQYFHMEMDSNTLAETTMMANPTQVKRLVEKVFQRFGDISGTVHFHNPRGRGLANVVDPIEAG